MLRADSGVWAKKTFARLHAASWQFTANAAWTVIAALAHNLLRWTQKIGLPDTTTRTGPCAAGSSRCTAASPAPPGVALHLPARRPWREDFTAAQDRLRALPPPA